MRVREYILLLVNTEKNPRKMKNPLFKIVCNSGIQEWSPELGVRNRSKSKKFKLDRI